MEPLHCAVHACCIGIIQSNDKQQCFYVLMQHGVLRPAATGGKRTGMMPVYVSTDDHDGSSSSSNSNASMQSPEQDSEKTSDGLLGCSSSEGSSDGSKSNFNSSGSSGGGSGGGNEDEDSLPVRVALGMLNFYKSGISPLMPSSCRFLPTCSEYSMGSYRKFGVWRGTVLTAWRLLRCNPWGGRGYDPPEWPPVGLAAVYDRFECAPQVTVVLGAYLFVYTVQGLLHELNL